MASCPGHACFIVRHCAYFLSHLLFVSLHSGCVTMCMFTTPLFLHSSFARILTYLVDALAPSGLLENMCLPPEILVFDTTCTYFAYHYFFISLDLRIPTSQNYHIHIHCCTHIPPYIHNTCPETPTFLYPYIYPNIPIFLSILLLYRVPIPTCPYVSLSS